MFYRLKADLLQATSNLQDVSHAGVYLTTGSLLPTDTITPFRFTVEVDEPDEDEVPFDEPLGESAIRSSMDVYYPNVSVMRSDLVATLSEIGVDNLQTFPAVIEPAYDDMELEVEAGLMISDYLVVNIIGLISCANLDRSDFDMLGDSYVFHRLVIYESLPQNILLFRLKEYPPDILVHERVASHLLDRKFKGLQLEKLETT